MHSNSTLDVFPLDLDAPELIQALEDFTKQILSPESNLSTGLEEAMLANSQPAHDTGSSEANGEIEVPRSGLISPVAMSPENTSQISAATTESSQLEVTPLNEDILPLSEPSFQILTDFGDSLSFTTTLDFVPKEEPMCVVSDEKLVFDRKGDFPLMDTYDCVYDAWGSPGSVESDVLFPDLAHNASF